MVAMVKSMGLSPWNWTVSDKSLTSANWTAVQRHLKGLLDVFNKLDDLPASLAPGINISHWQQIITNILNGGQDASLELYVSFFYQHFYSN